MKSPKPYNSNQWTEGRMRSFIKGLLRAGHLKWGPKHRSIEKRYIRAGKNPKTGRLCKLHQCDISGDLFAKGDVQADHIVPAVPLEFSDSTEFLGWNWNDIIRRMFVEEDGYQVISKDVHKDKTRKENRDRGDPKKKQVAQFRKLKAQEQILTLIKLGVYREENPPRNQAERVKVYSKLI